MLKRTKYEIHFYDVNDVKRDLSDCRLYAFYRFGGACNFFGCTETNVELAAFDHLFDALFWLAPIYQTNPENIYLIPCDIDYPAAYFAKLDYNLLEGDYYDYMDKLEGVEFD